MRADMEDGAFQAFLKRGRGVPMIVRHFLVRTSGRNKRLLEEGTACGVVLPFVASAVQAQQRYADAAVVAQLDRLFEERPVALRGSVGRQTHDFVFVGIEIETQVERDEGIQDSD